MSGRDEDQADWGEISNVATLLPELFHTLNQPLTTLRCALELSLMKPRTAEIYREDLTVALTRAEQIAGLAIGIQELIGARETAGDAQDAPRILELEKMFLEAFADWLPVAESAGVKMTLRQSGAAGICMLGEEVKLRQGLCRLFDFALQSSQAGAVVDMELARQARRSREGEARVRSSPVLERLQAEEEGVLKLSISQAAVASTSQGDGLEQREMDAAQLQKRELDRRLSLAIVRGIFESMQGDFHAGRWGDRMWLEFRVPLTAAVEAG